ncbi:MAG: hypothetical protein COB40_00665, partial [Marinosulfonomonas sp.]
FVVILPSYRSRKTDQHPSVRERSEMDGACVPLTEDGLVRIFYNPRRPEKSFLIQPGPIGYSFLVIGMLIPLILFQFH